MNLETVACLSNSRRYFAFGGVFCEDPTNLRIGLRMFLQSLHRTNLYPQDVKELKFSLNESKLKKQYTNQDLVKFKNIMPHVRDYVINLINHHYNGVFVTIINKRYR